MYIEARKYYVSDHLGNGLLLHVEGCKYLPPTDLRAFIGSCYSTNQAHTVSATQYAGVKYCPHCLAQVHQAKIKPVNPPSLVGACSVRKPQRKPKEKVLIAVRHFPI